MYCWTGLRSSHGRYAGRVQGIAGLEDGATTRSGTTRQLVGSLQRPAAQRDDGASESVQPKPGPGGGAISPGACPGAIGAGRLSAQRVRERGRYAVFVEYQQPQRRYYAKSGLFGYQLLVVAGRHLGIGFV